MSGGGGQTYNYPAQPTYGEGMADAMKAQMEMLTGGGDDFSKIYAEALPGVDDPALKDILRQFEAPLRKETAQIDTDVLRQTVLGAEGKKADAQGRVKTGTKRVSTTGEPLDYRYETRNGKVVDLFDDSIVDPMKSAAVSAGENIDSQTLFYGDPGSEKFTKYGANVLQSWAKETGNDKNTWRTGGGSSWTGGFDDRGLSVIGAGMSLQHAFNDNLGKSGGGIAGVPTSVLNQFMSEGGVDVMNDVLDEEGKTPKGTKVVPAYETAIDPGTGEPVDVTDAWRATQGLPARAGTTIREGGGMVDLLTDQVGTVKENVKATKADVAAAKAANPESTLKEGEYFEKDTGRTAGFDKDGNFLGLSRLGEDVQSMGLSRQRQKDITDALRISPQFTELMEQYRPATQEGLAGATALLEEQRGALTGIPPGFTATPPAGKEYDGTPPSEGMRYVYDQEGRRSEIPIAKGPITVPGATTAGTRKVAAGLATGEEITAPTLAAKTGYDKLGAIAPPALGAAPRYDAAAMAKPAELTAKPGYDAATAAGLDPLSAATGYDKLTPLGAPQLGADVSYAAAQQAAPGALAAPTQYGALDELAGPTMKMPTGYEASLAADPLRLDAPTAYTPTAGVAGADLTAATTYKPTTGVAGDELTAATTYTPAAGVAGAEFTAPTSYTPVTDVTAPTLGAPTSYEAAQAAMPSALKAPTGYEAQAGVEGGAIAADPLRQALMGSATAGLGTGLTAREQEQIERWSREAGTAAGRVRDIGRIESEVSAKLAEDRQRQEMNRRFGIEVLGAEGALQESDLARGVQAQLANQAAANLASQYGVGAGLQQEALGAQMEQQRVLENLSAANRARETGLQAGLGQEALGAAQTMEAQRANQAAANLAGQFGVTAGMEQEAAGAEQSMAAQLANQAAINRARETGLQAGLGQEALGAGQSLQAQLANQAAANLAAGEGVRAGLGQEALEAEQGMAAQLANQAATNLAAQQGVTAGLGQESLEAGMAQQKALSDQAALNLAAQTGVATGVGQEQMQEQLRQQAALANLTAEQQRQETGLQAGVQQELAGAEMAQRADAANVAAKNLALQQGMQAGLSREEAEARIGQQAALANLQAEQQRQETGLQAGLGREQTQAQLTQQRSLADQAAKNLAAQQGMSAALGQEALGAQLAQTAAGADQAAINRALEFGAGAGAEQARVREQMKLTGALAGLDAEQARLQAGLQAGLQQEQFGAQQEMQADLANLATTVGASEFDILQKAAADEANLARAAQAAQFDVGTTMEAERMNELLRQQGLGTYISGLTGLAQLEDQYSIDPIAGILGRGGGATTQTGQSLLGTAGYGLQSAPQYLSPETGLGYISNRAANEAAMWGAGQAADAAKTAGLYDMIGSIGGAATGAVIGKYCWVAREVYGAHNPAWLDFREWMLLRAPSWFRALYIGYGERFAKFISDKPRLKARIRGWMDGKIGRN